MKPSSSRAPGSTPRSGPTAGLPLAHIGRRSRCFDDRPGVDYAAWNIVNGVLTVSDLSDLRRLLALYAQRLDDRNIDGLAALFSAEAQVEVAGQRPQGTAGNT